ncbi:MBL fold metallo-hydrolase [Fulvivirgaceae bacterium BMA10]|uniref:MBL fold metallo-hydrolase n=1 Tax=Splendidivirga corallicola TaxID=3051826 RepID=A0ABT8KR79_9BACT|nr:MBL fold metallo-hydrolase [Fulvivirgaceae bacterium BMA10]
MMNLIKKTIKMIGITIGGLIVVILLVGTLFLNLSPQFGDSPTDKQKRRFSETGRYKNGKFHMSAPVSSSEDTWGTIKKFFQPNPKGKPSKLIVPEKIDSLEIINHNAGITKLTWFGHSTFLLQLDGKNILIDPMLGDYASPLPLSAAKRFTTELPILTEKLPFIDAVIYSHDHYDHLDYESVKKIKDKVGKFYVPLGLGSHLVSWEVESEKIEELDWWDTIYFDHIKLVCTPAVHFSGRGLFDRGSTLWCSWVILGEKERIFFSGDSGYGPHFKEIGEKYGPFDLSLMECGQYNEDWRYIHMFPEETAQAAEDVKSELLIPIHWGSFKLAHHHWTDPIERVAKKASELNVSLATPKIGEPIILGKEDYPRKEWWLDYVN